MKSDISIELINWYIHNKRDLPWRNTHDPYHIWVSEVILQQTRIAQGLSYYYRFIEAFPTVIDLANASQDKILKLWQGLGYYSRARNMHFAAKQIVEQYRGEFPHNYQELLKLKGIGEYTAAAVASISFNEAVAVVDGNVIRVIARLFAIEEPVDKPTTRKLIKELTNSLLVKDQSATFNQAIMEFGALYCVPSNPDCRECILNHKCLSFKQKIVQLIPLKTNKVKVKNRFFYYLVLRENNGFYFQKRVAGDIWEGLYEFPLIESKEPVNASEITGLLTKYLNMENSNFYIHNITGPAKHILTHQKLLVSFIEVSAENLLTKTPHTWLWIEADKVNELAVPRVIDRYIHSSTFNKI